MVRSPLNDFKMLRVLAIVGFQPTLTESDFLLRIFYPGFSTLDLVILVDSACQNSRRLSHPRQLAHLIRLRASLSTRLDLDRELSASLHNGIGPFFLLYQFEAMLNGPLSAFNRLVWA
ncbi:hypothetical protein LguiA_030602 [Lonicera macranthoides]